MKIPKELRWEATGDTVGEGGQAQVHLVKDKTGEIGGVWALKALKRNQPGQAYERFSREITAIKKLQHPNIIRVIDNSPPDAEFQFYVMEYIEEARPLEKVLKSQDNPFYGKPLSALDLFEQVCQGIVACENCGPKIIHRDLSPSNVLVQPNLSIKLIDFGLCQVQGHEAITLVDEGVGTVNYMAPECESGSDEVIGIGADLYSAGKLLWSAITGLKAFSRENPAFNGKSMPDMFPEDPSTWHLHHIFEKTIRRDWRNRWGSASEALAATRQVRYLIQCGYLPLEEIAPRCPICGVGKLSNFEGSHAVFGNPNPQGIYSSQCSYCGLCFAINGMKRKEILAARKKLE